MTASDQAKADGGGLQNSHYAKRSKDMMTMVNELRATGAAIDVDLPTIVVAGNQSSGKSSILESISGIKLPRSVGTCTRLPMEIRLKQRDGVEWTCVIKIRREEQDHDQSEDRLPEVSFGLPISDPALVESAIRRAQLAVLNPSVTDINRFVSYQIPEVEEDLPLGSTKRLRFSNDVVVLEITSPDQTDLTLVDLPGIIQSVARGEDKNDIALIENMVKSYISKDCLILLVIPMTDDVELQKAAMMARDADPEGKRTIGVLTKVDMIKGRIDTEKWLKVLQGQTDNLLHGYYVTRQPDPDELVDGISSAAAREQEERFFKEQAPWNTLAGQWKDRLGSQKLAAFLSTQLSAFIQDKLPDLESRIADRHKEVIAELRKLRKEPPSDPSTALLGLLHQFEASITKHVEGHASHERFLQTFNELSAQFQNEVTSTKPSFVGHERAVAAVKKSVTKMADPVDDEEDDDSDEDEDSDEEDSEIEEAAKVVQEVTLARARTAAANISLPMLMGDHKMPMYVDDMRRHIKACRTRELPSQVALSAFTKLVQRSTSTWECVATDLLNHVQPAIENLLALLIQHVFGPYAHGGLPLAVKTIVDEQIQVLYDNTQVSILKLVALELRPNTLNAHYLNSNRAKKLAALKGNRRALPVPKTPKDTARTKPHANNVRDVLAGLAAMVFEGVKEEDLAKLLPPDEYETEMDLMAQTSAYWKVAYKRFIDNIPAMIDLEFLGPLAETVGVALTRELEVFSEDAQDRCRSYLDERPADAALRKDLKNREIRLKNAKAAIRKFRMK